MSVKHLNALVGWVSTYNADGESRHLSHVKSDTPRKVTLDIDFDPGSKAGLFKLRAAVDIKNEMTTLFLYINPDRITSLVYVGSDSTKGTMPHVRFGLNRPADLVVPSESPLLLKRPNLDGETLTSLKFLAQETTLCVYMTHEDLKLQKMLRPLCVAVADQSLKPLDMKLELLGLYMGRGSKILKDADLCLPPPPPSYNKVGERPAPYSPRASKSVSILHLRIKC